jgi:chromosomal replication initiation ATPase DnaA
MQSIFHRGAAYFSGVNEALSKAGEEWEKHKGNRMSLPELIEKVASHLDLNTERIISASRRQEISEFRAIISCLAINDMPAPCSAACS